MQEPAADAHGGLHFSTFGLLILWLAALGGLGAALYLYPLELNEVIGLVSASTGWNTSHYYPLLWTIATGGIGGCLGTISFPLRANASA